MPCCPRNKKSQVKVIEVSRNNTQEFINLDLCESSRVQDVPEDFGPGYNVEIKGFITNQCSRFAVDFKVDSGSDADIAFHLNPRLAQHYIVRNSKINNAWGEEHTSSAVKFKHIDLNRNSNFDISIFLSESDYFVMINGKHACQYPHRVSPLKVKVIEVCGKVNVNSFEYRKISTFPELPFQLESVPRGSGVDNLPETTLMNPALYTLKKFQIGNQLEIYGRVKVLPQSFTINLQEGNSVYPHPMIHFHFNPRFDTQYGRLYLASNSWLGKWGPEQRIQGCQLLPYATFSLAIRRDQQNFVIVLDGKIIGEYRYRADASKIDTIYIQGDVVINYIYLNENFDDQYYDKHLPQIKNNKL